MPLGSGLLRIWISIFGLTMAEFGMITLKRKRPADSIMGKGLVRILISFVGLFALLFGMAKSKTKNQQSAVGRKPERAPCG
jgi:hypothetical protein